VPDDGYVTLVIEDAYGKRVRNLVADRFFKKGLNTVDWDGTDDVGRNAQAASHGVYSIPPKFVSPGTYFRRGLCSRPKSI
jgi:flagellar hook assembly protein FlgD